MSTTTVSPAAARRRLRLALRKAREASRLTQGEVAEALEWSISKVNRIENGEVTISATDLRALIALFGITDLDAIADMTRDARTARTRGWWDDVRFRNHLTTATLDLIQFEGQATAIRCFQPTLVPGLLQTQAYAQAVMDFWSEELDPETRAARLEVRTRRRNHLLGQPNSPEYYVIIDESVVMREIGGPAIMAEQLDDLLETTTNPSTVVRIVPFAEGGYLSMLGGFNIFDLGRDENAILYRETIISDTIQDAAGAIRHYRHWFEIMWERSYTVDESKRIMQARAARLRMQLDRRLK